MIINTLLFLKTKEKMMKKPIQGVMMVTELRLEAQKTKSCLVSHVLCFGFHKKQ